MIDIVVLLFRFAITIVLAPGHCFIFFFQAEDGIRDLVRSRGLGDVYKRQVMYELQEIGSITLETVLREKGII